MALPVEQVLDETAEPLRVLIEGIDSLSGVARENYVVGATLHRVSQQKTNVFNWREDSTDRLDKFQGDVGAKTVGFPPARGESLAMLRQLTDALFSLRALLTWYFDDGHPLAVRASVCLDQVQELAKSLEAALRLQNDGAVPPGPATHRAGGWPKARW